MINIDHFFSVDGLRPEDISGSEKPDSTYPIFVNASAITMVTGGGYDHIEDGCTIHLKDGSKVYVDESPEFIYAVKIQGGYEDKRSREFERLYDEENYREENR